MPLDVNFILRNLPLFGKGLAVTVALSLLAIVAAMGWGLVVALGRMSQYRALRSLAASYIEVARDTPVLVQICSVDDCGRALPPSGPTRNRDIPCRRYR